MSRDTVMWQDSNFFINSSRELQPDGFELWAVWKSVRRASCSAAKSSIVSIFIIIR